MEFAIIFAAMLATEAAWYTVARKRQRRERRAASLKFFLQSECGAWTEVDGQ
jgi:hypothetical protein